MAMADEKYKIPSLALFPKHYIAHSALPGIGNVCGFADFVIGSTVGNQKPSEAGCQPDKVTLLVVVSMTADENQHNNKHALFFAQLLTVQHLNRSASRYFSFLLNSISYYLGRAIMLRPGFSQMELHGTFTSIIRPNPRMFYIRFRFGIPITKIKAEY
jgi:hypothetical protein